jgi:hypothetical protein
MANTGDLWEELAFVRAQSAARVVIYSIHY